MFNYMLLYKNELRNSVVKIESYNDSFFLYLKKGENYYEI